MSEISYKVQGKNGDYVTTTVIPSNHSEEPHFGALDVAVLSFVGLAGVCFLGGLAWLLL